MLFVLSFGLGIITAEQVDDGCPAKPVPFGIT